MLATARMALRHKEIILRSMQCSRVGQCGLSLCHSLTGPCITCILYGRRYLPGISPAQPGLKIAFQRANLLSQFPDAFQPYLHFGVTLQQPLKGTLFRFPLR